jgi:hypothetical protein
VIWEPIFDVAVLQKRTKETEFEIHIYVVARAIVTYICDNNPMIRRWSLAPSTGLRAGEDFFTFSHRWNWSLLRNPVSSSQFRGYRVQQDSQNTNIMFLVIIYRPVYISKLNVSETGFCLRLQVKRTHLSSIDRARTYVYVRTLSQHQDRVYRPSTAQTTCES